MVPIGALKDRLTLQRYDDAAGEWRDFVDRPQVWALATSLGEERYEFRIRYRSDLFGFKDSAPAVRVRYRDRVLDLTNVIETDRRREVQLIASGRQIETVNLESGARRTQAWPNP